MIGAFGQQPVDEGVIDAVGREDGVGDALRRILVVIQAGRAKGQIEIGNDGIEREIVRDRPSDVVRDGGCPDAALGADDRDRRPTGLASVAANNPLIERTMSIGLMGAIR